MLQFGICGAIMTLRSILGHGKHAVVWHVCPYAAVGHGASLMLLFGISGAILNVGLVLGIGQHAGVGIRDFAPLFGVRDAVSANGLLFGPD